MTDPLKIHLFGTLQIVADSKFNDSTINTPPHTERLQIVFAYLIVYCRTPQLRKQIAFALWPTEIDSVAFGRLRKAFNDLSKHFTLLNDLYSITDTIVELKPTAQITTDLEHFSRHLSLAEQAKRSENLAKQIHHLEAAVGLYRGDFLECLQSEWIALVRDRLRQQFIESLAQLADCLEVQREYTAAIRYAQRCLEMEPEYEEYYLRLIRLQGKMGKTQEVERLFLRCLQVLKTLESVPSIELREAYLAASLQSRSLHFDPLPMSLIPFVGRKRDMAHLEKWVADPVIRLISIVGIGGIGKTRLAIEVGRQMNEQFTHGVCFVPLVLLSNHDSLITLLATTLRCPLSGEESPMQSVQRFLRAKQLLLIFDNFEQLAAQAALVPEILQASPFVKIIVTSRQKLNLSEEWVYELDGLAVASEPSRAALHDEPMSVSVLVPEAQGQISDALHLFVLHALRLHRDFRLLGNAQAILQICQQVSGMPLAIEMMASWTSTYTCVEIQQRLQRSFHFLSRAGANTSDRHRNMYIVFEQSWELLDEAERRIFAQLSVFLGGFTLDAAQRVTGISDDQLNHLTDHQFLKRDDAGRFSIHELLRQFGNDKLDEDTSLRHYAHEQHCQYYARLLKTDPAIDQEKYAIAFQRMRVEASNIRQMMFWTIRHRQCKYLLEFSLGYFFFLEEHSWYREGHVILDWAQKEWLAKPIVTDDEKLVLAQIQIYGLGFNLLSGRMHHSDAMIENCLNVFTQLQDAAGMAFTLLYLGLKASWSGALDDAEHLLLKAVEASIPSRFVYVMAASYFNLGEIMRLQGVFDRAEEYYGHALSFANEIQSVRGISKTLVGLGSLAFNRGDYEYAQRLLKSGEQEASKNQDTLVITYSLWRQAETAILLNNPSLARDKLRQSLFCAIESSNLLMQVGVVMVAGRLMIVTGDLSLAVEYLTLVLHHPNGFFENKLTAQDLLAHLATLVSSHRFSLAQTMGRSRQLAQTLEEITAWL